MCEREREIERERKRAPSLPVWPFKARQNREKSFWNAASRAANAVRWHSLLSPSKRPKYKHQQVFWNVVPWCKQRRDLERKINDAEQSRQGTDEGYKECKQGNILN
eukprot:1147432-Pelagomonas_calceolata.AAC.6